MKRFVILILTYLILSQFSYSQSERNSYGIFGHINLNSHTANFDSLSNCPSCSPGFRDGSGLGFSLGFLSNFILSESLFLDLRLGYFTRYGLLKRLEEDTVNLNAQAVKGVFEHTLDAKISSIGIEPMLGIRLWEGLSLELGFHAGLIIQKDASHQEKILEPLTGTYENNQRTRLVNDVQIPDAATFRLSLLGGLSYELPLNKDKTWFLQPEAFYSFGLNEVAKNTDWKINTLRLGLALKYSPKPEISEPPMIPPEQKPELIANINAMGVDQEGNEINVAKFVVEEFLSYELKPLLSYVFFDENSSEIPPRYVRLTKEEAKQFRVENLHRAGVLETYYNLLNIVGRRMIENPDAMITIEGCNSNEGLERGNTALSQRRAETIKNYLTQVWEIPENRIKLSSRNLPQEPSNVNEPDGIIENRRAEITTNKFEILAPITTDDTLRTVNPPMVRFYNDVKNEAAIDSWSIEAYQNGKLIKEFKDYSSVPSTVEWLFDLEQKSIPKENAPLDYKINVKDVTGQKASSKMKSIPVDVITIQKKKRDRMGDKYIDRFSLILFAYDKATISYYNSRVIDIIKTRVKPNSTIKILGHTDRIGTAERNQKLSQERADAVKKELKAKQIISTGLGENELRFNNNLPEGRFYCRRVDVLVETPIED
ncbi:MAG: OmpA family protein [Candidatus Kapabacteria bacterium]|nr:OmpA family protein [Candidatus Kapabacteria bacterium]